MKVCKITLNEIVEIVKKCILTLNEEYGGGENEMAKIRYLSIKDGTYLKAPNGRKSNLTEEQWIRVRTKSFLNWFGDWINNPESASKILDENGEPLVVYHNSTEKFRDFSKNSAKDYGLGGKQFWFRRAKNSLIDYGRNMYTVFLRVINPVVEDEFYEKKFGEYWYLSSVSDFKMREKALNEYVIANKCDCIISISPNDGGEVYRVFNSNQIKSATDNIGNYDIENNDITA